MEESIFNVERLVAESEELARESRHLRSRMLAELFTSTFLLLYWVGLDRRISDFFTIAVVVLNVTAWLYWSLLSGLSALRARSTKFEIPTTWRADQLAYQYEARARTLR